MGREELPPAPASGKGGTPRRLLSHGAVAVASLVIGIVVGQSIASSGGDDETTAASPVAEAPSVEAVVPTEDSTPSPSPTQPPVLDGTWQVTSCDLQLFTAGFDTSTLVGAVRVENTGNVVAEISVSLKWDALPGPLIDGGTKTVILQPGRSRELRFTEDIGGNDVDRVQSSPGYQAAGTKLCKVRTSIDEA